MSNTLFTIELPKNVIKFRSISRPERTIQNPKDRERVPRKAKHKKNLVKGDFKNIE